MWPLKFKITEFWRLLSNIGYIPCAVQYILEPILYPTICFSHFPTSYIALSLIFPLVTTRVYVCVYVCVCVCVYVLLTVPRTKFYKYCLVKTGSQYSVQFSCSVVSDSLRPHEPQHARPPCPSPTPGVHPNPCRWCHRTISSFSFTIYPSLINKFILLSLDSKV